MVVEVSFRSICNILFSQHGMNQFLGRRFTITSGDGNKRNVELVAMKSGQALKACQHIVCPDDLPGAAGTGNFFIYDSISSTFFQGLQRVLVTIKMFTL